MLRSVSHAVHRVHYTFAEYVAVERDSVIKHEYLGGQIYAMAGGTPDHSALKATVLGLLFAQLQGGRCRLLDSDARIRVAATGLSSYPDVSVICGPRLLDPEDENTVLNPTALVEVTSKRTELYDRTEKFDEHYRFIPTLREYVLVLHRAREIEVRRRDAGVTWSSTVAHSGERAVLSSLDCALDVDLVYDSAAEPAE